MDILVVIDMQNDFIDGALGTPEAETIVPNVVDRVKNFNGLVLATRDTHGGDYLQTQEGRMLPVETLHPRHLRLGDPGGDCRASGVRTH